MLIPLIFKNDDDLTGDVPKYSRIGKVPPSMSRAINAYSLYNKVGVFYGYANECNATATFSSVTSTATITFGKGLISVYGGVMLMEEGTQHQFTATANTNGYIGVGVDLSKDAGQEAGIFAKASGLNTNDLQANESTGKFDFILYRYSIDGSGNIALTKYNQFTQANEFSYIYDMNYVVDAFINGILIAKQAEKSEKIIYTTTAPTASPEEGTLIVYIGTTTPTTRYDRVLYLIY